MGAIRCQPAISVPEKRVGPMPIPHPTSSPIYPEVVMGTTTTLPTALEEGPDPSRLQGATRGLLLL